MLFISSKTFPKENTLPKLGLLGVLALRSARFAVRPEGLSPRYDPTLRTLSYQLNLFSQEKHPPQAWTVGVLALRGLLCAPGGTRTPSLRFRKPTFYPLNYGRWSRLSGSNRGPTPYKGVALPTELRRQI